MNIEEQIRKAMEDGQFDDLPGKGKPLKLDENLFEDPEWRLANKVMKDGGFTLPWIERRQEIESGLETARKALQRAWDWRKESLAANQPALFAEEEWQRAEKAFRVQVAAINRRIFLYNLETPSLQFQRPAVDAGREIEALTAAPGSSEGSEAPASGSAELPPEAQ